MAKFRVGDIIRHVDAMDPQTEYKVEEIDDKGAYYVTCDYGAFWIFTTQEVFYELVSTTQASFDQYKHKCHCDIKDLLHNGCKCGGS